MTASVNADSGAAMRASEARMRELGSPGFQRTTLMGCLSTGWHQVPGYRLTGGAFLRHHPSAKKNEPAQ